MHPRGEATTATASSSAKAVQQQLGHSSATVTLDTYGYLFPDKLADGLDQTRSDAIADFTPPGRVPNVVNLTG